MRCLRVRLVTGHSGGPEDQPGDTTVVPRDLVQQGLGLALAWSEVPKAPWSSQSRVERREAGRVLHRTRVRVESADDVLTLLAGLGAPIPLGKRKRGQWVARNPLSPGGAALAARAI